MTPNEEQLLREKKRQAVAAIPMHTPGSPVSSNNSNPGEGIAAPPEAIMINGIRHQNIPDQKFPGPLSMMADAAGETIKYVATAPFSNRAEDRLAANRAELNNDTAAPSTAKAVAPAIAQQPAIAPAPAPTIKPGFDKSGVVTADSAAAAMSSPVLRSGGIASSYDGKGVNEILARENQARGEMIDSMVKAQGGNGIAVMPDRTNDANEQLQAMKLSPQEYLAYMQAKGRQEAFVNEADARNGIAMRGQDLHAKTEADRLAGNPIDNQLKQNQIAAGQMSNATAKQLQDLRAAYGAEKDPAKRKALGENIRVLSDRDAASKYLVVAGGEYTDPENPLVKMKSPSTIFDTSTGQMIPAQGSAKAAPAIDKKTGKQAMPKVGDVIAGHKFLGGNPADPKSWESLGIAAQ